MNNETTGDEASLTAGQQITIIGPLSGQARTTRRDVVERAVDVAYVRQSFRQFLEGLSGIISVNVPVAGAFELEEVQFSAEISANGEFKLLGTGVGVEATSGVVFTLRRKQQAQEQTTRSG